MHWRLEGLKTSLEQIVVVDVLAFVTDAPGAVQGHASARVPVAVKGAEGLAQVVVRGAEGHVQEVARGAEGHVQEVARGVEILVLVVVLGAEGPAEEVVGEDVTQHVPVSAQEHVRGSVHLVVLAVVLPRMYSHSEGGVLQ